MRYCKTILLTTCFFISCVITHGQTIERFNVFTYNVNEGLLQSTVADIAFDKNNFCWLSFPNGIQKFDGKNFTTVPVQPGLPDDKQCYFFECNNGDLLISHSEGISKYEIAANKFVPVYTSQSAKKLPLQFIGQDENTLYIYTEKRSITGIDCRTFKIISDTKTNFTEHTFNSDYKPKFSNNIINHKVAINVNSALYLWDLQQGKILFGPIPVPDIAFYFLLLKNDNEVSYCTSNINNALQQYNFVTNTHQLISVKDKDDKTISRCVVYNWQNKILISFNNRLYQTDTSLAQLQSELVNFQNQPIATTSAIWGIKEDNFGNLYLVTVTGGIRKIIRNNYPVKYYGTEKKEDNFILSVLPDKINNRVLAGTSGNGLLVFDTLQRLIKHIKTLPGQSLPFSVNTIVKNINNSYLLFISDEQVVWQLSNDLLQLTNIPVVALQGKSIAGIGYFGNFLFQNNQQVFTQSQSYIYKTNFANKQTTEYEVTNSYTMSGLLFNNVVITHANNELVFLDTATFKPLKKIPFKNTGHVRCFAKDAVNNIYLGSNKGIFKIDSTGKILQQLTKKSGLPDECIYAIAIDNEGFLWCSTNKGILKINKDNSIVQLKKEDGLQENEFNTNVVAKTADGEIFFGGVNGVSSFYAAAITNYDEKVNLFFTQIKINNEEAFTDTAVWNIDNIKLPYNKNSLSFDFVAMANNNPGQYIYQYRMQGIDEQWIQNSELQTIRYFLPPGDYVFEMYASRFFDKDAKAMKAIHITIRPPFWKTWWFTTVIVLLITTTLAYTINRYNKRKYQSKLLALESEHKLQLERERISRDLHDNIGAYANAVLYSTELLQKENDSSGRQELMNDLKFASKDIITSLRETVWALKKDNYTAEDCWMRIKNFVQALSRYYPNIQFKTTGDAPGKRVLHHTAALNLVRIVQESVTNAIKHAAPATIHIGCDLNEAIWILTITDDGKGFAYESTKDSADGNGLQNMLQRAADSGFKLNIIPGVTNGTIVSIQV